MGKPTCYLTSELIFNIFISLYLRKVWGRGEQFLLTWLPDVVRTHLGGVFVNIDVNNPSVFVTLLDDIILDLNVPARLILPRKQEQ